MKISLLLGLFGFFGFAPTQDRPTAEQIAQSICQCGEPLAQAAEASDRTALEKAAYQTIDCLGGPKVPQSWTEGMTRPEKDALQDKVVDILQKDCPAIAKGYLKIQ